MLRVRHTFSITLELNFCFDNSQTRPRNWRINGSENCISLRSTRETLTQVINTGRFLLTNILHDVVSEWVLHKLYGMSCNLLDQLSPLFSRCMVDTTLKNAAAMAVSANGDTMLANSIEYELLMKVLGRGWITRIIVVLLTCASSPFKRFKHF